MSNLLFNNQTVNHHLILEKGKQRLEQLEIKGALIDKSIKELKTKFVREQNEVFPDCKLKGEKGQNKIEINWGTRSEFKEQSEMSLDFEEEDFEREKNENGFDNEMEMDIMERKSVQNIGGHNKAKNLKTLWGRSEKVIENGIREDSASLANKKLSPVVDELLPVKHKTSTNMQRSNISMTPSNNSSVKSNVSIKFNLDEYIENCEKQKQDVREIEEKALKLKNKSKLERQLVRKLRNELNSNRNIESKTSIASGVQFLSQSELENPKSKKMRISSYSTFSNFDVDNPNNIKVENVELVNSLEATKMLGSVALAQLSKGIDDDDDIANEEEILMEVDNVGQMNIEKQLKEKINELEMKFMKCQKELKEEKEIKETFEKNMIEITAKNVLINCKFEEIEKELESKNKRIKKLEDNLEEKINLIKIKDIKIEELCGEIKMKASLVESFGFENSLERSHNMNGGSQENLADELHSTKKELELVKNVLTKLRDSKEEYFKQFLIDSVGIASEKFDKKKVLENENENSFNENKESDDLILEKKNLTEESIEFVDSSSDDNFSIPSEALSEIASENEELKQSVELLSSKLKNIQTQLQKVEGEKHSMVLNHSSLEERIMLLESENLKVEEIKQCLSFEAKKLKNELYESTCLGESLRLEKEKIKEESEQNIKSLMKMMEEEKNREIAERISEIAIQLEQALKMNEEERTKLQKRLRVKEEENRNGEELNKKLEEQIRSNMELSFHLELTINKQKMEIEKLEDNIDRIKDENDKYMDKSELLEVERNLLNSEHNKLKDYVQMLNCFVEEANESVMKYKMVVFNQMYQQRGEEEVEEELEEEVSEYEDKEITLSSNKISPKLIEEEPQHLIHSEEQKEQEMGEEKINEEERIKELEEKIIKINNKIIIINKENILLFNENNLFKKIIEELKIKEEEFVNILELFKKEVELARCAIEEQEQELSITRLEKQQLEQSNENAEIEIDLLNKMVENLKIKLKEAEFLNNKEVKTDDNCSQNQKQSIEEFEEEKRLLNKEEIEENGVKTKFNEYKEKRNSEKIKNEGYENNEREEKYREEKYREKEEENIELHIELDILEIQIKELIKEKEMFMKWKNEKEEELSILGTKYELSLNEMFKLNTQISILTNESTNTNSCNNNSSTNNNSNSNNSNNNSYNNGLKSSLEEIFKNYANSFNNEFMDIIKEYVLHVCEMKLIKENETFLFETEIMLKNILKQILDRKTIFLNYSDKCKEVLNKEDDDDSSRYASLSNSPLFVNKNSKNFNNSTKKKYKEKIVESADKNDKDNFSQSEKSLSERKSMLLSEDAGSAFSLEETYVGNKEFSEELKAQSKKNFESSIELGQCNNSLNEQNREDNENSQMKQKQKIEENFLQKGKKKGVKKY